MPRKARDVTAAELAVLERLWQVQGGSVREMSEHLYGDSSASNMATVQKLLGRLEDKACVRRDRSQWPHRFDAIVQRGELIERRLQNTANELCAGQWTPLLTHLVHSQQLDAVEREHLRELLEQLDQAAPEGDASENDSTGPSTASS